MNRNCSAPLNIALQLFRAFDACEVKYCHWKGNDHLLGGMCGDTDLDILMAESSREKGQKILSELKFLHLKAQYGSCYPFVEDWVGFDAERGRLVHVHLHFRIVSGHQGMKEYTLPFTDEVMNTRIKEENWGVYVTQPDLELLMLYSRIGIKAEYFALLKARLGRFSVSEHDRREILYLKEHVDNEKLADFARKFYGEKKDRILEIISRDNYDSVWLLDLHRLASKNFKAYNRAGYAQMFLRVYYRIAIAARRYICKYLFRHMTVKKTMPNDNGVIAVFVGQDGAGKSTVTKETVKWLRWKMDARRFYFGSGDGYRSVNRIIAEKLKGKGGFANALRAILAVSNYRRIARIHLTQAKKMKKFVDKGGIAICDRYPQMQFAGISDGPKIRKLKERTGISAVRKYLDWQADKEETDIRKTLEIKPDILLKLVLPVEESMRRKPEENEEVIRRKNKIIEELNFETKKSVYVRADQDYEQELTIIYTEIWDAMCEKSGLQSGENK